MTDNNNLPSISNGKTEVKITDFSIAGNSQSGFIGASGEINHNITPNTQVFTHGNIDHTHSFQGHGSNTSWTAGAGVRFKF